MRKIQKLIFLIFYLIKISISIDLNQTKYYNVINYEFQNNIVNYNNFKYLLNPKYQICPAQQKVFLLIYVHSSPGNNKKRLIIRETWSQKHLFPNVHIVFFSGLSANNQTNEMLKLENSIYNDIVQKNFVDSYRNLTLKSNLPFFLKIIGKIGLKIKYSSLKIL